MKLIESGVFEHKGSTFRQLRWVKQVHRKTKQMKEMKTANSRYIRGVQERK